MATPGGHSRLNSGSTVVLACGVSMPARPRGAYSSDMVPPLIRRLRAGFSHHLAESHQVARDDRAQLFGRAGDHEHDLRQHLVLDLVAPHGLDEFGVAP